MGIYPFVFMENVCRVDLIFCYGNPFVIAPALFWAKQVPVTRTIVNPSKKEGAGV